MSEVESKLEASEPEVASARRLRPLLASRAKHIVQFAKCLYQGGRP